VTDDAVVHLEELFGAEIMVWRSGMATICAWDEFTNPGSPAARDLAATVECEGVIDT